jgi:diketogulonate reductase-like aldo/keto reductase
MKTVSNKNISKIGIGTYGIGGKGHRDMVITEKDDDGKYIDAIAYTLGKGSNFTEISLGYGHGNSLVLFKKGLIKSGLTREDVFITHSFYPHDLKSISTMEDDATKFYEIMDTVYADSTLVTQSLILNFGKSQVYSWLENLLLAGKTRFVSLSNASPDWIKDFKGTFKDKFFAHEGHISFEVRSLQDKEVFRTCEELGVENIIWRPLRRSKTLNHSWPLLFELSEKYQRTQSQIVLNWICELGYRPMVFSTNINHIDDNLASTEFKMSSEDYIKMTEFRPEGYLLPEIDWEGPGIDNDIVNQVNNFEDFIKQ